MARREDLSGKIKEELSIKKDVWRIGIPAIAECLFTTLMSIVDTKMVSALGITAISAVSVTNQPRLFLLSIFFALNIAISATVARYMGAKKQREANELFVSAFWIAAILSIVIGIICVIFAKPIIWACSGQADTLAMSVSYYRVLMGGVIFNVLFMLTNSALRGCGYTKVTLISNIVSFVVNVVGNYLLIGGHFGFPALGVTGAAIATVISTVAALVVSLCYASKDQFFVNLQYCFKNHIKPKIASIKEIAEMWITISIENLLTRAGFLIISMITARIGSYDMSVYSIGMTIMNISFAFGDGFQSASVALVGKSLGAKEEEKVYKYKNALLRSGIQCAIVLAAIVALGGRPYYSFFSNELEFVNKGTIVSIIIAVIIPFQICQLIYNGVLKTMGKTRLTLIAAVISVTIINPIIDYVGAFTLGYGIWGIWAGTLISQVARFLILVYMYRRVIKECF